MLKPALTTVLILAWRSCRLAFAGRLLRNGISNARGDSTMCNWHLQSGGPDPVVSDKIHFYYPSQGVQDPDPCRYEQLSPQPDPTSSEWGGSDPDHGRLWTTECPDALVLGIFNPDGTALIVYRPTATYYVPDGLPPGTSAPDPQSVLDRAIGKLTIPTRDPRWAPICRKWPSRFPSGCGSTTPTRSRCPRRLAPSPRPSPPD